MPGMEVFWLVRVVCGHAAAALASAGLAGADWARLADGGEEQQVVRDAGEEELTGDGWQAAEGEAAQAGAVLEAGVHSFDVGGAALV